MNRGNNYTVQQVLQRLQTDQLDDFCDEIEETEFQDKEFVSNCCSGVSPVALQLRAPPKVSARAPAHRSYHFRGVKLKSCIKKIYHNLYISKQANVRIKHADTEGASHKKFGTDARVQ